MEKVGAARRRGSERDVEDLDSSTQRIIDEFEVPITTAIWWDRSLSAGDIEKIGANGPPEYRFLIRRREELPYELRSHEDSWVQPLQEHCVRQSDRVHLADREQEKWFDPETDMGTRRTTFDLVNIVEPSRPDDPPSLGIEFSAAAEALRAEIEWKSEIVKYHMRRVDEAWQALLREQWDTETELMRIYRRYLDSRELQDETIGAKTFALKRGFPYLQLHDELVARTLDSTVGYVSNFRINDGESVKRNLSTTTKQAVKDRDGGCLSCDTESDLIVHHIIPHNEGGSNDVDNLATLCRRCHYFAHGGGHEVGSYDGYTAADWGTVEYDDREGWEGWIDQSFGGRTYEPRGNSSGSEKSEKSD